MPSGTPGAYNITRQQDGSARVATPPDPRTGATCRVFDPATRDWIHALTMQIRNPGQHWTRYYGAYSNRTRSARGLLGKPSCATWPSTAPDKAQDSELAKARRASGARLLRKISEVDPLLCPSCVRELKIIAVLTDPAVVDRILRQLKRENCTARDPFEPRPPPYSISPFAMN